MKIVLASGNKNKYYEIKKAVEPIGIELIFGGDFEKPLQVEETGKNYKENALLKAKAWASSTGLSTMSDDSGLEVFALKGAPGINSARIVPGDDANRNSWLLNAMQEKTDRKARFVSCIAVFFPNFEKTVICEKYCYGTLATSVRGDAGFGYDPIFIPEGYDKTFAELGDNVKRKISHRALAIKGIAEMLIPVIQYVTERTLDD